MTTNDVTICECMCGCQTQPASFLIMGVARMCFSCRADFLEGKRKHKPEPLVMEGLKRTAKGR